MELSLNLNDIVQASKIMDVPLKNLRRWVENGPKRKKGGRKTHDPEMETKLYDWIKEYKSVYDELPLRRQIKSTAMKYSNFPHKFKASKGWYEKFMLRHFSTKKEENEEDKNWNMKWKKKRRLMLGLPTSDNKSEEVSQPEDQIYEEQKDDEIAEELKIENREKTQKNIINKKYQDEVMSLWQKFLDKGNKDSKGKIYVDLHSSVKAFLENIISNENKSQKALIPKIESTLKSCFESYSSKPPLKEEDKKTKEANQIMSIEYMKKPALAQFTDSYIFNDSFLKDGIPSQGMLKLDPEDPSLKSSQLFGYWKKNPLESYRNHFSMISSKKPFLNVNSKQYDSRGKSEFDVGRSEKSINPLRIRNLENSVEESEEANMEGETEKTRKMRSSFQVFKENPKFGRAKKIEVPEELSPALIFESFDNKDSSQ